MLDHTDMEILRLLKENGRLQWREIGDQVHLSGPAVANRIQRMEKAGILKGYTVQLDYRQLGLPIRAYINVFMKSPEHAAFTAFLKQEPAVERADRISGEGCYLLTVRVPDEAALNRLLDSILQFGNYRLSVSIGVAKE